jgi:hypothetical protein
MLKKRFIVNKSYTKDNLNEGIRNAVFSVSPKEV